MKIWEVHKRTGKRVASFTEYQREADFTTILTAKQIPVKKLEGIKNDLLHITDEEREDGAKYVFATRVNKETIGDQTRAAIGLWNRNELYIDNDLNQVFKRINEYYV